MILRMQTLERPLFLYDADCGFCEQGTQRMRRRLNPPIDIVAYQRADLEALGVTVEECLISPVFINTDGTHVIGARSMLSVFATASPVGRAIAATLSSRVMLPRMERLFTVFYRNRHRMPGGDAACQLPEFTPTR